MKKSIEKVLIENGCNPKYNGFDDLVYALENRNRIKNNNMLRFYHEIAEELSTTYTPLERNIRTVLNNSYLHNKTTKEAMYYLILILDGKI